MIKSSKTREILFFCMIFILVGAMAFLLYLRVTNFLKLSETISKEKVSLLQDKGKLQELKSLSASGDKLKTRLEQIQNMMPDSSYEDELIKYLQKKAYEASALLIEVSFSERIKGETAVEMPIKIVFHGNYESLMNLLELIRNGERAIRIDEVSINNYSENEGIISAELTGKSFYIGEIE